MVAHKEYRVDDSGLYLPRDGVVVHELHKWKVVNEQSGSLKTAKKKGFTLSGPKGSIIETPWLVGASETYNISDDPRDYVIAEVPLVTADIPNCNMDSFPYVELTRFSNLLGNFVYKTFTGKPTFREHDNQNPLNAKGVNFDSVLRKEKDLNAQDVWKVRVLAGFDRTKDRYLAEAILKGERNAYSMGALVGFSLCSVCGGATMGRPPQGTKACRCVGHKKGSIVVVGGRKKLKYDRCFNVNFIENSSVEKPADFSAESSDWW